jgi:hypothetical protein
MVTINLRPRPGHAVLRTIIHDVFLILSSIKIPLAFLCPEVDRENRTRGYAEVCSRMARRSGRMRTKIRRRLDAALRAKVALEAFWNEATGCRAVGEVSASLEPDLCLEEAAARRRDLLRRDHCETRVSIRCKMRDATCATHRVRQTSRLEKITRDKIAADGASSPRRKSTHDSAASCRGVTPAAVGSAATGHSRSREKRCFRHARIHVGGSPKSDTFFPSAKDRER